VGDLVLAVNGVPVWKPEDADLLQLKAACSSQAVVLYCVNMDALRQHFGRQTLKMCPFPEQPERIAAIHKVGPGWYDLRERQCIFTANVDHKTQLFEDCTEWEYRIKNMGTQNRKVSYKLVCLPTFQCMNKLMSKQLDQLKVKIVARARNVAVQQQQHEGGGNEAAAAAVYVTPSAPSAPVAMGIVSEVSSSDLPVATAFLVCDESATEESYEQANL
jgi:hypothetical protein